MRINFINNNFNFGKTYIGKTNVRINENINKAKVIEYDPNNQKDRDQILPLSIKWAGKGDRAWEGCQIVYDFFAKAPEDFKKLVCLEPTNKFETDDNCRFIGLENEHGDILALAEVVEYSNSTEIPFMQTGPKLSGSRKNSTAKNLYETLASVLVKITSKNKDCKYIEATSTNFHELADKCDLFKEQEYQPDTYKLTSDKFNKYVKYVKDKFSV